MPPQALVTQPSLLDPTCAGTDPVPERRDLDDCCWVDLWRGWQTSPDDLFDRLCSDLPWKATERRMFDRVVTDPRLGAAVSAPSESLRSVRRRLERHYASCFGAIWCNLYRRGSDSVAWHGDRTGPGQPVERVAVLSLGGTRTFRIRPVGGGPGSSIELHSGDLLVMGGRMQEHFEHAVPKRARAHARISVTFRARAAGNADRRMRYALGSSEPKQSGGRRLDASRR